MDKYRQVNQDLFEKINEARETKQKILARSSIIEAYDQKYKEALDEFYSNLDTYKVEFEHYKRNIQKTQKRVNTLENKFKGNEATLEMMLKEEDTLKNDLKDIERQNNILLKIISEIKD